MKIELPNKRTDLKAAKRRDRIKKHGAHVKISTENRVHTKGTELSDERASELNTYFCDERFRFFFFTPTPTPWPFAASLADS
jgi:hypothetical protein